MVAAEAACFGVPVVASRRGGLPEIVRDDVTGFLVNAEAPRELAEKLRLLIEDAALRERMGRAARLHAAQHFTQERMAEQMEAVFVGALESSVAIEAKTAAFTERAASTTKNTH